MSINSIIQFLVIGQEHTECEPLLADFEHLLADYKIAYYGIMSQPKPVPDPLSQVLAGRWPNGWPELYIEKKYILLDPTIRFLPMAMGGYSWNSTLKHFAKDPNYNKMRRMLEESRRFGMTDGYVFPVYGRHGLKGSLTIGGSVELEFSPLEIVLFEQVAKIMFLNLLRFAGNMKEEEFAPAEITQRELEILNYLADGYTSHEIGRILSISNHTVDWHMNSIQDKLGARNRQHAVARALRSGLVI